MLELLLPEGRIVKGHPLFDRPVTDDNNRPVLDSNNQQKTDRYIAIAIPKNGSTDWKQTEWGAQVVQAASDPVEGYTAAEQSSPVFSWKIVDGDSEVPNRKGNAPKDQEGFPGHWVIHLTTALPYAVYANGNYAVPVTDKNEIKTGDFARIYVSVKGNKPAKTPGVYINPRMAEITRAGQQIVSDNLPSAASVFGGSAPAAPATPPPAAPAPNTPPPAPAAPATPPPVPVEEKYDVNGTVFTRSQLLAMPGWNESHLIHLPKVG
jgi:hypothetical protein